MSLGVALQSVAYYVFACAPCHKCAYRRRRKREAAQAQHQQGNLEVGEQGLYQHPSPFSTNLYWREEMNLGPGPPEKKKNGNNRNQRALTAGTESSTGSSAAVSQGDTASPLELHLTADERLSGDNWNRRRYQREDEDLWGHDRNVSDTADPQSHGPGGGSSVGVIGVGKGQRKMPENYHVARNPPVNELHPAVVSTQPTAKKELKWMLQPPPSVHVMSGKMRINRSRSDSGGSRKGEEQNLGRQVGERLLEAKIRRGAPSTSELDLSGRKEPKTLGQSSTASLDDQQDDGDPRSSAETTCTDSSWRKKRPPPIRIAEDAIARHDETSYVTPSPRSFAVYGANRGSKLQRDQLQRPALPLVTSSSSQIPTISTMKNSRASTSLLPAGTMSERRPIVQRAPDSTSSLQILQTLVSPNSLNNARTTPFGKQDAHPPALPPSSPLEDRLLTSFATFRWGWNDEEGDRPHLITQNENWEDDVDQQRRPMHRWSMDI
ncbi:MAG: hypothetical protein M1837_004957 [Sclerophora amabilis]|nr:MAG: hypothetical protein M1837_004957 [Sclerophora amabilis]